MEHDSTGADNPTERWDQLYDVLSDETRRILIFRLMDEPKELLPLPEAAESPNLSLDSETLCTQLRHYHLPKMADAGYIRWEEDPFCVQRGPLFQEAAIIIDRVTNHVDQLPNSLIRVCKVLQEADDEK